MTRLFAGLVLCAGILIAAPNGYCQTEAADNIIEYLEFREVDIKDILRQLSKQYDLNIVFSESVKGLVTVQLANVTIEQALDSVVTINGFAYTKKGNVYKVTSQEEASREGKQTKLFRLNNADAVKLKDTLAKVLSPEGVIEADVRSNSLIVTDTISAINRVDSMVPSLDEVTAQVLIEAKIIETSLTNTEKLGIDWTTTIQATGASRPTTFPFKFWGSSQDMYPVPTYTSSAEDNTVTSDFAFGQEAYLTMDRAAGFSSFPTAGASQFVMGTLNFSALKAVLDVIKTRSDSKLVASPRIMTTNNQQASINVGKVVPIATYEMDSTTGNWRVTGWENMNVGVNLEVTPQISPDGHIKLKLKPEVSNIVEYIGTDVNRRPVTSTRTASTEVVIQDGMTVVIGGLVKEKESTTKKKIPFLGNIPFLGRLFSRDETGTDEEPKEKTDLLIFVTATVIKDKVAGQQSAELATDRPFKAEMRGVDAHR
ncbi:MAG: secretin N-terminal domain-containing protein [Candidatus Omnitrophota bacterium]